MRFLCVCFLCLWFAPALVGSPKDAVNACTLTITGTQTTEKERIDLGAFQQRDVEPGAIYLALTNLTPQPFTYIRHSAGPDVSWEFDVDGRIYKCATFGEGSGVWLSKTLQPRQAGVIPTKLFYGQIPQDLRALILSENTRGQTFVDVKVRASLTVYKSFRDGKGEGLTVTSDWANFRVGSVTRPQDMPEKGSPEQPATGAKAKAESQ